MLIWETGNLEWLPVSFILMTLKKYYCLNRDGFDFSVDRLDRHIFFVSNFRFFLMLSL